MDGTDNQTDSSAVQDTSEGEQGTSATPETFTQEQVDKAVSDALSKAGRDAKSLDKRGKDLDAKEQAVNEGLGKITQWEQERRQAELEDAKDNPELVDVVKEKHALKDEKSEFGKEKSEHLKWWEERQADVEAANEAKKEIAFFDIAQEHGVDAGELKEACEELNLSTREQFGSIAKRMVKSGEKPLTEPLKPDSSKTIGGKELPESARGKIKAGWDEFKK